MRRWIKSVLLLPGCTLLSGCPRQQSVLDPTGPQAALIEHLWWVIFWITLVVYCIVLAIFTAGILKRRVQDIPPPTVIHESEREKHLSLIVAGSTFITIIILFV